MFEDKVLRECRLGHGSRKMKLWEDMASKTAKNTRRSSSWGASYKPKADCHDSPVWPQNWWDSKLKISENNTFLARSSQMIAYWAARLDAYGIKASVTESKGCHPSQSHAAQRSIKSKDKSLDTHQGDMSLSNTELHLCIYEKHLIRMLSHGKYLLVINCNWHKQSCCSFQNFSNLFSNKGWFFLLFCLAGDKVKRKGRLKFFCLFVSPFVGQNIRKIQMVLMEINRQDSRQWMETKWLQCQLKTNFSNNKFLVS